MTEQQLADEIVARLNKLIESDDVRKDIERLIAQRVPHSDATRDHPTIQVGGQGFGVLGLLNGLVAPIEAGPRKGWGRIAGEFDEADGKLLGFRATEEVDRSASEVLAEIEATLAADED